METTELVTVYQGLTVDAMRGTDVAMAEECALLILGHAPLTSDEEAAKMIDAAKVCRLTASYLDEQLKSITRPLDDAKKAARALAVPHIDRFDGAVKSGKALITGWSDEKRRREDAARREAERIEREAAAVRERERLAAIEAGKPEPIAPPAVVAYAPAAPIALNGSIGGTHETTVLKLSVESLLRIAQSRPHLLTLDMAAARAEFRSEVTNNGKDGAVEVFRLDGIKAVFEKTTVLT